MPASSSGDQVDTFGQPVHGTQGFGGTSAQLPDVGHCSLQPPLKKNSSLNDWHIAILDKYSKGPTVAFTIQLNHPPDPYFQLLGSGQPPAGELELRTTSRRSAMPSRLAEYATTSPLLLRAPERRGFRVAPPPTDLHAFRQGVIDNPFNDIFWRRAQQQWVMPYFRRCSGLI